jgi:tyrosine-protein kinase Etk/Wzc
METLIGKALKMMIDERNKIPKSSELKTNPGGKLLLLLNDHLIGEYLVGDEPLTIGRAENNDIQINSPLASLHHATVIPESETVYLEDLDSENGTYRDGQRIIKHALRNEDTITIGKHQLKYINKKISTSVHGKSVDVDTDPEVVTQLKRRARNKKISQTVQHFDNSPSSNQAVDSAIDSFPYVSNSKNASTAEIYLNEIIGTLIESKWFIIKIVFIFLFIGIGHILLATPIYRTDALLQVEQKSMGIGALADFSGFSELFDRSNLSSEIEILKSRKVLSQVVNELKLDIKANAYRFPVVGAVVARIYNSNGEIAKPLFDLEQYAWGGEKIKVEEFDIPDTYIGTEFVVVAGEDDFYQLYDEQENLLGQGHVGETMAIKLSDGESLTLRISELRSRPGTYFKLMKIPMLSVVANLQAKLKVEETGTDDNNKGAELAKISLEGASPEQISIIVNKVIETYTQQNSTRKASIAATTLKLLTDQITITKEQLEKAEKALNKYRLQKGSVDLPAETQVVLKQIVDTETQISQLRETRKEMLLRFTDSHPKIKALDAKIDSAEKDLNSYESKVKLLPDTQQEILRLSREVEVATQLYTMLLNKAQELSVVKEGTKGNVYVIDDAAVSYKPVKPKKSFILTLYLLLGGMLGGGGAILRQSLFGGVKDPDIIEKELGLPVYTMVPQSATQKAMSAGKRHRNGRLNILAVTHPKDPAIESLRSFRTSLQFALLEVKNSIIAFTSSGPNDGKSFVSLNLGVVLANTGKRVLVIDADLRKGYLHQYLGMDREGGVADVIAGDKGIEQVIRNTGIDNLSLMTTGTLPPNPSELLLHGRFGYALEKISPNFDYVIIDTPPSLAVTDAAIISQLAGATFLVLKSSMHPIREIDRCVKRLRNSGANVRGVVLNEIQSFSSRYGYGKHYGYAYKYSH